MNVRHPTPPRPAEPVASWLSRTAAVAAALGVALWPMATPAGRVAVGLGWLVGAVLARAGASRRLRPAAGVALGLLGAAGAWSLGSALDGWVWLGRLAGPAGALGVSDVVALGGACAGAAVALRSWAGRHAAGRLAETALALGAIAWALASHRRHALHEPRALADWAWSMGLEPSTVLLALGLGAAALALLAWAGWVGLRKQISTVALVVALSLAAYGVTRDVRLELEPDEDELALGGNPRDEEPDEQPPPAGEGREDDDDGARPGPDRGGGQEREGGDRGTDQAAGEADTGGDGEGRPEQADGSGASGAGSGGGGGQGSQGDGEAGGDGEGGGGGAGSRLGEGPGGEPTPVAVVLFHDDFEPKDPVLYFRQQVLSAWDGTHLAPDRSGRFDGDVVTRFPTDADGEHGAQSQASGEHASVPTSVYLMVDHPQPIALTHAAHITPRPNPNPRRFVAAYDVESRVRDIDLTRLVGRLPHALATPDQLPAGGPPLGTFVWDEAARAHYLQIPDDPRYASLADEILRDVDPRFAGDPVMHALAIRRYLEREGYYTRTASHRSTVDPTASFLFGSLRGYCVHFAHAAVFLMRAAGIPARVALGYAVDTGRLGAGSAVLVLSHQAHAWPEIHVPGFGWVPFDLAPERSDEAPAPPADADLARLFGELARQDASGGLAAEPAKPFEWPWAVSMWVLLAWMGSGLLGAYLTKLWRRAAPRFARSDQLPRLAFRAVLDALTEVGAGRQPGETRHAHAQRVAEVAPSFVALTAVHLRAALGTSGDTAGAEAYALSTRARAELRRSVPVRRRVVGWAHPLSWLDSR